jgi:hypothetical protein
MNKGIVLGLIVGATVGFVTSSSASRMAGLYVKQWLRLVPAAQEFYVAGMLDVMGSIASNMWL